MKKLLNKLIHKIKSFLPVSSRSFHSFAEHTNCLHQQIQNQIQSLQPVAAINDMKTQTHSELEFCPYCGNTKNFGPVGGKFVRPRGGCSICGSSERDRALFYVYQLLIKAPERQISLLHMAPEHAQYYYFKQLPFIDYTCMDLYPELYSFAADIEKQDALHTTYADHSFDFIIANHVLEHLDETLFLSECKRLLKKDGRLIITIPVFWDKYTLRDDTLCSTPESREEYYGQKDHIIRYGKDVLEHLSRHTDKITMLRGADIPPFGDELCTNIFIISF